MENKDLTKNEIEQQLDYEGWVKYIESLYDTYRKIDENNEKEKSKDDN